MTEPIVDWHETVAKVLKDLKRADKMIGVWELKRAQAIKWLLELGAPMPTVPDLVITYDEQVHEQNLGA